MIHLTLTLPFRLAPYQLPALRGAVNELLGQQEIGFHNHDNRPEAATPYRWNYPLIRYTLWRGRACVQGIGAEGAALLSTKLLPALLAQDRLGVAGRNYPVAGFRLEQHRHDLRLTDQTRVFNLHRWVALNQDNYRNWKNLEHRPAARQELLGRVLTGHLRLLAEALAPELPTEAITAEVLHVDHQKRVRWHGTQLVAFNVRAQSRLLPPPHLGLGRLVAFGFGEVTNSKQYERLTHQRTPNDTERTLSRAII